MVSEGRELADADLLNRAGPAEEAQNEARLGWVAMGLHEMSLDWLSCGLGFATLEELEALDNPEGASSLFEKE